MLGQQPSEPELLEADEMNLDEPAYAILDRTSALAALHDAYLAAVEFAGRAWWCAPVLAHIRSLEDGAIGVLAGAHNNAAQMLGPLGVRPVVDDVWTAELDRSRMMFLGCRHRMNATTLESLRAFVLGGGILVSSDKSAELPFIRDIMFPAGNAAPRRGRMAWLDPKTGARVPLTYPSRVDGTLLPPVELPAGHTQLGRSEECPSRRVLVIDALTGDPLVVLGRAGAGSVLHSVAHWYPDLPREPAELERRTLHDIAAFREIGAAWPSVTFGEFLSAWAMLTSLLRGLAIALGDAMSADAGAGTLRCA